MATAVPELAFVIDCAEPTALAPFWSAALGYVTVGSVHDYTVLAPDGRDGPNLLLQRVPEAKAGKNRMHLDLHTPDIEAEATRLESLGARRLGEGPLEEHGATWIRMADPDGNEFCVCDASGEC
ncbi:MAG: VOC family protein [Actinobacteria bacterium]|nr:VOC family protein [Actinomycetota bacterium]